ncbi:MULTISPECIES: phosphotyrosine protein phosphatase [unclassified Micromonospora]|uniref:arsenate reductase/protein-tyrosine-phosphatase family protein n=1 Tax=unclassified Micromonospora TaxID=2617518 RepID=UPI001C237F47|nr:MULTISPECIES: phosphotyrosine protein phosphatase [unclassified Micromonospora]MBU8856786.1 phosphotyrosine protein phosphatase [Micromonospora sp. WMMB482]MDM4778024.1 phosphotyrosine protein phosphatase [Micromonospora sp. b486]MDM4782401.1 phosphotyrosine protein phosphatase [Micromonospora sp. b486]
MPPFTVLHVCMGNICRSPMAERLLLLAVRERLARLDVDPAGSDALVHSHSAGTGGWHAGEEMNPPAARQVISRGGDTEGFAARRLRSDLIDAADLVLTATADQQEYVVALRPDAAARTFVLGEFGRLLGGLDRSALPAAEPTPDAVYARGVALVAAADAARQDASALPTDDLDDPWGRGDQCFSRVADEIEETVQPLAAVLFP